MLLLSLLLLCIPLVKSENESVTVHTKAGTVVGTRYYLNQIEVNRFLGIPFAKPPLGKLRFKYPKPVYKWRKPVIAQNFPPACVQSYPYYYPWVDKQPGQSEDCLYLNIWTPKRNPDRNVKKAVLFWIYSGAFNTGSNRLPVYDGQVLAALGDVIVVTVNYRVGIFGFLSTGTKDAPGNMGFLDVLTALKWVNKNIEAFGGDKSRITVSGHSAGSIISAFLTISPLSKGLFQRVIMESGAPFQLAAAPLLNLNLTIQTANAVGCSPTDMISNGFIGTVVDCFRTKEAHYLAHVVNSFNPSIVLDYYPIFGDKFLPVDPLIALKTGLFQDVDVLVGFVQDEASFFLTSTAPEIFGPYGEKDPKINKTLGRQLILKMLALAPYKYLVADHYLSDVDDDDFETIRRRVYHSLGDDLVVCPTLYFTESFSRKKDKTYLYYYYHQTRNTVYAPWMGVTHFTEVQFVFGRPFDNPGRYCPAEQKLSAQLIKMWTDFAKKGVPSTDWQPYSRQNPYIQKIGIGSTGETYTLREHLKNCEFYRPLLLSP